MKIMFSLVSLVFLASCAGTNTSLFRPSAYQDVPLREVNGQWNTVVIRDDPGGFINPRKREVDRFNRLGVPVEIRGRFCNSSCTMYLGVKDVCVEPNVMFGFHGPSSRYGLSEDAHDHYAELMSMHYPPAVKRWYEDGPKDLKVGFKKIRGIDLAPHGIKICNS